MGVFVGLLAAGFFGSGDFLGGRASSQAPTPIVLFVAQLSAGLGAIVLAFAFTGDPIGRDLAYGAAAGLVNAIGLGFLYQGLSTGRMGLVAPIAAVVGAVIPVAWGLISGEEPGAVVIIGVLVAVAAGALISRETDDAPGANASRSVVIALIAGAGLGTSFVLFAQTGADSGLWPVLSARVLAVLGRRRGHRCSPRAGSRSGSRRFPRRLAILAGLCDVGATAFLVYAIRHDLAVVVAPIAALGARLHGALGLDRAARTRLPPPGRGPRARAARARPHRGRLTDSPAMPTSPTPLPITDRPIRIAVVGLGQIAELMLPPYLAASGDRDRRRCATATSPAWPAGGRSSDRRHCSPPNLDELLRVDADVVDVLVPTPVPRRRCRAGVRGRVPRPAAEADRPQRRGERADPRRRRCRGRARCGSSRTTPSTRRSRSCARSCGPGRSVTPVGVSMKIVNTGRGGWDVLPQSWEWQFEQTRDGRGMLVFDHGWHQLAVAVWLFGPIRRIFGWIGSTELAPGFSLDAPATLVWEHHDGLRGVLDLTLAPDTYFRSDYYTCDERVEVTAQRGSVRCNRISSTGRQEPSVEVYRDGEIRGYHALADAGDSGFVASTQHLVDLMRGRETVPDMSGETAHQVITALTAALESSERGIPIDL